jgi:hypothetical protein
MKVLVCGDRFWTDKDKIRARLAQLPAGTIILHGAARGADSIAAGIAQSLGFEVRAFPADWNKHGKAAGPIRNREMLNEKPDLVIAFHPNLAQSKGTKDTVGEAKRRGIPVELIA